LSTVNQKPWILGISGASGQQYAVSLLRHLLFLLDDLVLVISEDAKKIIMDECAHKDLGSDKDGWIHFLVNDSYPGVYSLTQIGERYRGQTKKCRLTLVWNHEMFSSVASGSFRTSGMVVVPASLATLGKLAQGITDNVLLRASEVCLKENRSLILVPRETPLSLSALENLLQLKKAGAQILPAMPAFYHRPQVVEDIVEFISGKICNLMDLNHRALAAWEP